MEIYTGQQELNLALSPNVDYVISVTSSCSSGAASGLNGESTVNNEQYCEIEMNWFSRFFSQANKEPIALVAVALTLIGFIYERDFFHRLLRVEPTVTAYHLQLENGRCPMVAFDIENAGTEVAEGIRISILEDWITARGDEELYIYTFEEALIGRNEPFIMERRSRLDVVTELNNNSFVIPALLPGEYVQRILMTGLSSKMSGARAALANDPVHRTRPKIGQASYKGGVLNVNRIGDCLNE